MPVPGVGSIHEIDFDELLYGRLFELDLAWLRHLEECPEADHEFCVVEQEECLYSDAMWEKGQDGQWKRHFYLTLIQVNWHRATYQVIRSGTTEKHGWASPCYPGQAEVNTDGDIECFVLPDWLRRKVD